MNINNDNKGNEIMELFRSLNKKFRNLKRERFKDMNLTGNQGMIIGMISHHGPVKMSELSHHMNLSPSTVSEMVNRLEKSDVLIRKRDENDKRIVTVDFSEKFKIKSDKECKFFSDFTDGIFNNATEEELKSVKLGLSILNNLLELKIKENNISDNDK